MSQNPIWHVASNVENKIHYIDLKNYLALITEWNSDHIFFRGQKFSNLEDAKDYAIKEIKKDLLENLIIIFQSNWKTEFVVSILKDDPVAVDALKDVLKI